MRWPIRNQILLPFATLQVLALVGLTVYSSWLGVSQVEADITSRLTKVHSTLETASFPLTPAVLDQLKQLSGAEFVVMDANSRVTHSTLGMTASLTDVVNKSQGNQLGPNLTGAQETLSIGSDRYFAARVQPRRSGPKQSVVLLYSEARWQTARREAILPPLIIGSLLLLLTMTASVWIARRLGGRIQHVERQVSRIAAGDFAPLSIGDVNDELQDLSQAINRMAVILDESFRNVRQTERSALLTQLVGGLAHQLRNALTGARLSVQLHQRHCPLCQTTTNRDAKLGDPKHHDDEEALDIALQQLRLTEEQIKSLLRVTRGETRTAVAGDLGTILAETVALVQPVCRHQGIELQSAGTELAAQFPDADALRAAVLNLAMNAIEAAGPGGRVEIVAVPSQESIIIEVRDNGPGFPSESTDQLFTPFYSTKPEGVGLGLSLVMQCAQDCGGSLSAHRVDMQTIFRLTLALPKGIASHSDVVNVEMSSPVSEEEPS
ncbi:MAG: HAMP domain-containing sensor histidine kinase [Planctomycetaceae bacterium]